MSRILPGKPSALPQRPALLHFALNAACFGAVFVFIYYICSHRFVDFADEGFYYTSAWLAYSGPGELPVSKLFMNFGKLLGVPYLVTSDPSILQFRLLSLSSWYLTHFWFFSRVRQLLSVPVGALWLHALSLIGLYVFLIPSLSYQNMPYLFVVLAFALLLQLVGTSAAGGKLLSLLLPLPTACGIISYTPFAAVAPLGGLALHRIARASPAFSAVAFWCGAGLSIILLILVFGPSIAGFASALAFLNNEVVYTDTERFIAQAISLAHGLAVGTLAGFTVAAICIAVRRGRADREQLAQNFVVFGYVVVAAALLLGPLFSECRITCDATVVALINAAAAGIPVLVLLVLWSVPSREILVFVALQTGLGLFISMLSNAPFQYNIKYASPALIGILLLVMRKAVSRARIEPAPRVSSSPQRSGLGAIIRDLIGIVRGLWHRAALVMPAILLMLFLAVALRVILFSSYGASSIWESSVALPGAKFRGLYGEPSRARMLVALAAAYERRRCARDYFAAVDSLVLPYFLFSRKPPFPHAWIARRAPASRAMITAQLSGCVMMQDRLLPETPGDATTMLGYLRLDPQHDEVAIDAVGDGFYLIRFVRAAGAGGQSRGNGGQDKESNDTASP